MSFAAHPEVCVVGGGPAGLSAAIALAGAGFETSLVDCAAPPIDKACGEGLLPDALAALRALGITLPSGAGFPFRGIAFLGAGRSAVAAFPRGIGLGIRRTVLHSLLVERAAQLNVRLLWGTRQVRLAGSHLLVDGEPIYPRFVIAADGQNSPLRREAGLHQLRAERRRYGFRVRYSVAPWSDYVELHWGPECQLYITPIAPDEVSVALISRRPGIRMQQALAWFPQVRERLAGAPLITREAGALSVSRRLQKVYQDNLFLVGDASGSVDAVTGEGICLAFRQSLALAAALRSGNYAAYQSRHDAICRRPRLMARLLLMLDAHPGLRRRALAGLERHPAVLSRLLSFHLGENAFSGLLSSELVAFCRVFLTA